MGTNFLPKSRAGKWSFRLIITFWLLFGLFQVLIASGQRGGETFFDSLTLSIPASLMGICGILAFFTGAFSVIRRKERAVTVLLTTVLGFFILIFVLGEIFFEH